MAQLTDQELAEIRVGDYSRLSVNQRVSNKLAFYMIEEASQPLVSELRVVAGKWEGWVVGKLDL
jgi:translation initiation factor RLI1